MKQKKSPGLRLKEAREAQGKSLSEMAKLTRIGLQQLEGIEGDNYDRIPAAIYVKGFVKNYARKLGLDPDPLVEDVEKILNGDDGAEEEAEEKTPRVPEPVAEDEEPVRRTPPTPHRTAGKKKAVTSGRLRDLQGRARELFSSIQLPQIPQLPVDRRLGLIAGTVLVILMMVFGFRSCAGGGPDGNPEAAEDLPVRELENLLIATPEPILFELPRTTP